MLLSNEVVQGSAIGLCLFVLFINDIAAIFSNGSCLCKLLFEWQLSISVQKCSMMHIHNGIRGQTFDPSFIISKQ